MEIVNTLGTDVQICVYQVGSKDCRWIAPKQSTTFMNGRFIEISSPYSYSTEFDVIDKTGKSIFEPLDRINRTVEKTSLRFLNTKVYIVTPETKNISNYALFVGAMRSYK